jgi:LysR family transcriptional regulator, benzoate and cis,cis-muconate-responsive activator of ben and cat genes
MKLRHLQYFVAVADELNMRVAAEKMHISQPPLSRQIRELEKELGMDLFARDKKKLRLTPAGEFFLKEAKEILMKSNNAAQMVKAVNRGTAGSLSIAYRVPIEGTLPTRVLRKCREVFPSMKLTIMEMPLPDQIIALLENRIDLGYIGFRNAELQDILNYETILKSEIIVMIPSGHRLLKKRKLDLAELAEENFIFVERAASPLAYDWLVSIPRICGFTPNVVQEADTPRNLVSLVAAGLGLSLVPDFLRMYAMPEVAFRPLKHKIQLEWSIAWRKDNNSPILETYLRLLRDELKKTRGSG